MPPVNQISDPYAGRRFALHKKLLALGIPIAGVMYNGVTVRVDYTPAATVGQKTTGNSTAASWNWAARGPRLLADIVGDLTALSAGQKTNINTNMFTNRPAGGYVWEAAAGKGAPGIAAIVAGAGSIGALTTPQKIGIMALYIWDDNPDLLVQPSWDATINVAGDQLI